MSLRADVDKKFIRRFLYIAIGCFGFMLWGGYDALYNFPNEYEASKKYKELHHLHEDGEITEDERATQWEELREANSWPSKPRSTNEVQQYIYFNWFLFGAGLGLGIFFLIKYYRLLDSWMEAKDGVLTTSWGESLKFANVSEVNKSSWAKKGIAKVAYSDDRGAEKVMVLDDFKYERATVGEILKLVENELEDDQIIGAQREGDSNQDSELADQDQADSEAEPIENAVES